MKYIKRNTWWLDYHTYCTMCKQHFRPFYKKQLCCNNRCARNFITKHHAEIKNAVELKGTESK